MTIDPYTLLGALLLGGLNAGHCALMCGPLAVGCAARCGTPVRLAPLLATQLVRISVYAVLAVLVQQLGGVLLRGVPQDTVAAIGRVLLLLGLLLGAVLAFGMPGLQRWLERPGHRLIGPILLALRAQAQRGAWWWPGLLWGLLPCATVYALLITTVAAPSAFVAAATLLAFGLGTVPVLLVIGWGGVRVGQRLHGPARRWWAMAAVLMLSVGWLWPGLLHGPDALWGCAPTP